MDLTAGKSLKTEKHRQSIRQEEMNTISHSYSTCNLQWLMEIASGVISKEQHAMFKGRSIDEAVESV